MRLSPALLASGALLGAIAFTGAVATGSAVATDTRQATQSAAAEVPPSTVERFQYPHANAIFEKQKIRLKSGDGHIMLAECTDQEDQIEVWSSQDSGSRYCFTSKGQSGYLSLELPRVYGVKSNDYKVRVDMSVANREVSFDVKEHEWAAVGKTTDPEKREHTLLEIFTKK